MMALSLAGDALGQSLPTTGLGNVAIAAGPSITEWYHADVDQCEALTSSYLAYVEATKYFSSELTQDECKRIWLADKASMKDVITAVESAKAKYEAKGRKGKVQERLNAFSSRIMYYSSIMDMLSQHHPEYVALAWGTMKFLFVGLLNHEELLKSIAKTLCRIAEVLPRVELDISLYNHPLILSTVSRLYAHIIKFVQYAVSWYKKGKVAHGVASILHPFKIKGQEMVDEITRYSRQVDQLANSASRAEIRGLHIKLMEMKQFAIGKSRTLNLQMSIDIKEVRRNQLAQISVLPSIKTLPSATQALSFQIAVRNRDRTRQHSSQEYSQLVPKLQNWASQDSSLLLMQGGHEAKGPRFFATDVIEMVSRSSIPVIWALSDSHLRRNPTSLIEILRMLTMQALDIPRPSTASGMLISPSEIEGATTDMEWLLLLQRALRSLLKVYVVIDMDALVVSASRRDQDRAVCIMNKLVNQSRSIQQDLKIILTARRFPDALVRADSDAHNERQQLVLSTNARNQNQGRNQNSRARSRLKQSSTVRLGCRRSKDAGLMSGLGLTKEE